MKLVIDKVFTDPINDGWNSKSPGDFKWRVWALLQLQEIHAVREFLREQGRAEVYRGRK